MYAISNVSRISQNKNEIYSCIEKYRYILYTKEVSRNYKRAQRKRESKVCSVAHMEKQRFVFLYFKLDSDEQATPPLDGSGEILDQRDFHTDFE